MQRSVNAFGPLLQSPLLKFAGDFSQSAPTQITVAGGTLQAPGRTVIVTRTLAGGARAKIVKWSAKIMDVGNSDQLYFAFMRNGIPLQASLSRVPGLQFDTQSQIDLDLDIAPGVISIVAFNISGMSTTLEPNALDLAVDIKCQAWWSGMLLSERGGFPDATIANASGV